MTMAKAAAIVMAEARARAWWRQHWRRLRRWWQRRAVSHHPVVVVDGGGKDVIATAAIHRRCSRRWLSLPPSMMTNDNRWLLVVDVVDRGSGNGSR